MKLSISNIAWPEEESQQIYEYLQTKKYQGIEIAPTILIPNKPYDNITEIKKIKAELQNKYNLEISSIQSIWYGKTGNIFNHEEAKELLMYTKQAIDFASAINCKNIVFGCPKNRNIPEGKTEKDIIWFFKELGDYAKQKNTFLSLEANPAIYGTNFLNTTQETINFVKEVNSEGLKINLDFGTIIENKENLDDIYNNFEYVNHIHISEPYLKKISKRKEHLELSKYLKTNNYDKYISIEMKKQDSIDDIKDIIDYVFEVFK